MSLFGNSILAGSAGQGGADLGDTIEQSLRFPTNAGSERLEWATGPSTTTSWTVSFWMKLGQVGQAIDGTIWQASGASSGPGLYINHNSAAGSDMGVLRDPNNGYSSGRSLRDPSAWYHIVHTFHASGGTNRVRIYINGETALDTTGVGATIDPGKFRIGGNAQWPQPQFQGYMAEWHFVSDNGNLTAADFGRTNDDGIWVPQDYTGSHGSDGFYLKFDSSGFNGSGGIGADHSGNGNDFTASNFDTAAISSSNFDNDIDYFDTPTSNYATLNPLSRGAGTPSEANLSTTAGAVASTPNVPATIRNVTSGDWYFEFDGSNGNTIFGIVPGDNVDYPLGDPRGNGTPAIWFGPNTVFSGISGVSAMSLSPSVTSTNHIQSMRVNIDNEEVTFYGEGTDQGTYTFAQLNTNLQVNLANQPLSFFATPILSNEQVNYGQRPFVHRPSGLTDTGNLQTNNLPEPTIKNGKDHFEAVIWSGDGTSPRTIATEFQPDLVWIKSRSNATSHFLYDSVRGFGNSNELSSNSTRQEGDGTTNTAANGYVSGVTSSGFTLTAGTSGDNYTNDSSRTYVGWAWKAGGTAVSNTDGTITSSVSANTDAGFSIVSYTGNGTAGATVGHGLNEPPEFMIFKSRTTGDDWSVYHKDLPNGSNGLQYLILSASSSVRDTAGSISQAPTSDLIRLNGNSLTNASGTMIAYCWHSIPGYSAFGSYTGNSNANGPFVYTGFRPAFILYKCSSTSSNWHIRDNSRNVFNPANAALYPNLPNIETANSGNDVDLLSNGFKIRNGDGDQNITGQTWIWAAFAESPFGGENQPPVTAR